MYVYILHADTLAVTFRDIRTTVTLMEYYVVNAARIEITWYCYNMEFHFSKNLAIYVKRSNIMLSLIVDLHDEYIFYDFIF